MFEEKCRLSHGDMGAGWACLSQTEGWGMRVGPWFCVWGRIVCRALDFSVMLSTGKGLLRSVFVWCLELEFSALCLLLVWNATQEWHHSATAQH